MIFDLTQAILANIDNSSGIAHMEEVKHGRGLGGAFDMLALFESVGVQRFDITHTNIDQEKRGFRAGHDIKTVRTSMPHLLRMAPVRQNNIILRPHRPAGTLLIQLDDIGSAALERIEAHAFMTLNTSPGNYQAWLAVEKPEDTTDKAFTRRVRKALAADPNASGATRVAGTLNFKRKYEADFPVVEITAAHLGRTVKPATLIAENLIAPQEPPRVYPVRETRRARGRWPSYAYTLAHAPAAHNSDRPDISRVDFAWCVTAIDWGFSIEDTANRLMDESAKAQENGHAYALATATNAANIVYSRQAAYTP